MLAATYPWGLLSSPEVLPSRCRGEEQKGERGLTPGHGARWAFSPGIRARRWQEAVACLLQVVPTPGHHLHESGSRRPARQTTSSGPLCFVGRREL